MQPTQDHYVGCLMGLAMGDALGAPYEGGILERSLWYLIGRTREGLPRWTDDTQMALDLAASLIANGDLNPDDLATRLAQSFTWSRGYGPGTARLLKRVKRGEAWSVASKAIYREGSFGNGAAMRSSVLALFFLEDMERLISKARQAAQVTHAHPLAIEGAILITISTHILLNRGSEDLLLATLFSNHPSVEFEPRLACVKQWLESDATPTPQDVAKYLGNQITAQGSCVTALYIALRYLHQSFEEMIKFTIRCGGDVDTLGAMAGTLWGVYNGAAKLPTMAVEQADFIERTAMCLYERAQR